MHACVCAICLKERQAVLELLRITHVQEKNSTFNFDQIEVPPFNKFEVKHFLKGNRDLMTTQLC